jgi:hypothetical protein
MNAPPLWTFCLFLTWILVWRAHSAIWGLKSTAVLMVSLWNSLAGIYRSADFFLSTRYNKSSTLTVSSKWSRFTSSVTICIVIMDWTFMTYYTICTLVNESRYWISWLSGLQSLNTWLSALANSYVTPIHAYSASLWLCMIIRRPLTHINF